MGAGTESEMESEVELRQKVAFLSRADSYAEEPSAVESIETHMAWVFLTDRYAYKLKKPVKLPFLDFSTLERRKEDCRLEVVLNRRLADGVYLGSIPLTANPSGRLALAGEGKVVDWLVHMRRLPQEKMLDERIRKDTVEEDEIRRAAVVLAEFFRRAPPEPTVEYAYVARFKRWIREDQDVLRKPSFELPADLVEGGVAPLLRVVRECPSLLEVRADRLIEGHGDLRPEHVCLETKPVIFDCLEFNREFRIVDPVDELAFLSMECDRLGATFVEPLLLEVYESITGDRPDERLVRFYKARRACLRAKLAVWHLDDHGVDVEKWTGRAREYLELAGSYAADC